MPHNCALNPCLWTRDLAAGSKVAFFENVLILGGVALLYNSCFFIKFDGVSVLGLLEKC